MGSRRPNYGRVKGMYDHQGLAGGRRWGPSLGGQINHNSYTNPNCRNYINDKSCPKAPNEAMIDSSSLHLIVLLLFTQ